MPTKNKRPIFLTLMIALMVCFALLPIVLNLGVSSRLTLGTVVLNPVVLAIRDGQSAEQIQAMIESDPTVLERDEDADKVVEDAAINGLHELYDAFASHGLHLDGSYHTSNERGGLPVRSPLMFLVQSEDQAGVEALLKAAAAHKQDLAQVSDAIQYSRQNKLEVIEASLLAFNLNRRNSNRDWQGADTLNRPEVRAQNR